jgi:hypothetical protein
MTRYTVSLRIAARTLDTDQVTRELSLAPTQTRAVGERRNTDSVWDEALWELEVFPEGRRDWDSLESGLETLLDVFTPSAKIIQEYFDKYDVLIWCGQFSNGLAGFAGGPKLSAEILRDLGDFGIPLVLQTYFSDQSS